MQIRPMHRAGFTLLEVMLVMAILIIFAAVAAPTVFSLTRDTKVKAAADTIRARANEARAAAVGENRTYRFSLSSDGTRVRVAPDDTAFDTIDLTDALDADEPTIVEETLPKEVTAQPIADPEQPQVTDDAGWVRVATFKSDGTTQRDSVIEITEAGVAPLWVRIRSLTGATTVGPKPKQVP